MGDSKVTITNVTLDSILQDRLSQNTDNSNVKITIPYTVFEALKARNASGKDAVTLEGTHSNVVLTPGSGATTSKTRLVPLLTSKDANYPNIRSRLVSRLNMSGAQAVTASQGQSQGQVLRPVLAAAGKKGGAGTFEKVTVQPIPQLQPVRLGKDNLPCVKSFVVFFGADKGIYFLLSFEPAVFRVISNCLFCEIKIFECLILITEMVSYYLLFLLFWEALGLYLLDVQ